MGDQRIDNFILEDANQCAAEKHTTPFGVDYDMDQMKAMVRDADPATVKSVAQGWADLSKDLVGSGGIKDSLDTAVEHVLAHWEGKSADLFKARAQAISKKLTDSAKYADNTSQSLQGAAVVLEDVKPKVLAMEKPGKISSGIDYLGNLGDRDGGKATDDAIKSGTSSQDALSQNAGSLSQGREAQLKMAAQMEVLGAAYNSRAKEMGSWKPRGDYDNSEEYPGDPGGMTPAPVVVPAGSVTQSPDAATSGTARGAQVGSVSPSKSVASPEGITGGAQKQAAPQAQVSTAIDGISGGSTAATSVGGGTTVGGGSAGGTGVGGGSGFVGGTAGGAVGSGAARAGMAGRAGAAGMASRAGAGSVGGAAGAAAAKGGAARAGGMARQSGGVVGGTPRAGTGGSAGAGRGTAGGSGLHSSRGAAAGRGASAVRKGGMVGAPGTRTGRPNDEEQREGERPDYLVEDEETWAPQTNAAPPVIEE